MTAAPRRLAPEWLLPLQRVLSDALRTPLATRAGQLRADELRYPAPAIAELASGAGASARGKLAVYNRQYWFRLFGVLHREYRLATALLGAYRMNLLGSALWSAQAPSGHDLATAADGLPQLASSCAWPDSWPLRKAVMQAFAIDSAHREVFRAPAERAWRPGAQDAAALGTGRLQPSSSWRVVEEDWPLVGLRRGLPPTPAEEPLPLPTAHGDGARAWLVCRTEGRIGCIPLEPTQARLYALLREHTLSDALVQLELVAGASPALEASVRAWLEQSVGWGLWTGVTPA